MVIGKLRPQLKCTIAKSLSVVPQRPIGVVAPSSRTATATATGEGPWQEERNPPAPPLKKWMQGVQLIGMHGSLDNCKGPAARQDLVEELEPESKKEKEKQEVYTILVADIGSKSL